MDDYDLLIGEGIHSDKSKIIIINKISEAFTRCPREIIEPFFYEFHGYIASRIHTENVPILAARIKDPFICKLFYREYKDKTEFGADFYNHMVNISVSRELLIWQEKARAAEPKIIDPLAEEVPA